VNQEIEDAETDKKRAEAHAKGGSFEDFRDEPFSDFDELPESF
jgi:hypothetical protein